MESINVLNGVQHGKDNEHSLRSTSLCQGHDKNSGERTSEVVVQTRNTARISPIQNVTESESSTPSERSPQSVSRLTTSNEISHPNLRLPSPKRAFDVDNIENKRPLTEDMLESNLLVTPLPLEPIRLGQQIKSEPNQYWSASIWNQYGDKVPRAPSSLGGIGVGIDDMWNDFGNLPDLEPLETMLHDPTQSSKFLPVLDIDSSVFSHPGADPFDTILHQPMPDQVTDADQGSVLRRTSYRESPETVPVPDQFQYAIRQRGPRSRTPSRYRGVTLRSSGKWQAQIYVQGTCRYLGMYETEQEAASAYEKARRHLEDQGRWTKRRTPNTSPTDADIIPETRDSRPVPVPRVVTTKPARRSERTPRPNKKYTDEFEIDVDAADDLEDDRGGEEDDGDGDDDEDPTYVRSRSERTATKEVLRQPQRSMAAPVDSPILLPVQFGDSPGGLKRTRESLPLDQAYTLSGSRPKFENQYNPAHPSRQPYLQFPNEDSTPDIFFPDNSDDDRKMSGFPASTSSVMLPSQADRVQMLRHALQTPLAKFVFDVLQQEQRIILFSILPPNKQHLKRIFRALFVEHGTPLQAIICSCHDYVSKNAALAQNPVLLHNVVEQLVKRANPQNPLDADMREKLLRVDTQLLRLWSAHQQQRATMRPEIQLHLPSYSGQMRTAPQQANVWHDQQQQPTQSRHQQNYSQNVGMMGRATSPMNMPLSNDPFFNNYSQGIIGQPHPNMHHQFQRYPNQLRNDYLTRSRPSDDTYNTIVSSASYSGSGAQNSNYLYSTNSHLSAESM